MGYLKNKIHQPYQG